MAGTNSVLFQPRTKIGKALLAFWDTIDISENLHRASRSVSRTPNGLNSAIHLPAMIFGFIFFASFAWFFDFQSTIVGMQSFQDLLVPSLPSQATKLTTLIVFALSLGPTIIELFTAGMAKENIKIVQITIIGMSLFDMITDIPRAYAFSLQLWPQLDLLPWYFSYLSFWGFFFFWLFMSTFGFEVLTVIFGFNTLSYAWKWFDADGGKSDRISELLNKAAKANNNNGQGKVTIDTP